MSRTGTIPRLFSHVGEPEVELNPQDCQRRGFDDGGLVRVKSKRGNFVARVKASTSIRAGQAFMPMHWGGQFMRGVGTNAVTLPVFDPISKQPELKHCAVAIEKLSASWQIVAMRCAPVGAGSDVLALHARLQPWLQRCDHATLTLAGREEPLLIVRGWIEDGHRPWDSELIDAFDRELGLADPQRALSFVDAKRNISKRAILEDGKLSAVRLAGEIRAADWLRDLMISGTSVQTAAPDLRRWLLAPIAQPPAGSKARGRVICNCLDVSEDEIIADLNAGLDLPALQEKRKCGMSCGSCLPELKRLVAAARHAA
jgi:assimilatory nitrate reductase catalytic subunit